MTLDSPDLQALVIDLAIDIWRLRVRSDGETAASLVPLIERLTDDLAVHGVELIDPTGHAYDQNASHEVVYRAPGDGALYISETIAPGVSIHGRLLARPKICLATRGGQ